MGDSFTLTKRAEEYPLLVPFGILMVEQPIKMPIAQSVSDVIAVRVFIMVPFLKGDSLYQIAAV